MFAFGLRIGKPTYAGLILPGLANAMVSFIEFVIYLVKSDQDFYRDYVVGDRTWF